MAHQGATSVRYAALIDRIGTGGRPPVIQKELRRRNVAVLAYAVTLLAAGLIRTKVTNYAWGDTASQVLGVVAFGEVLLACWFYLRAKRRGAEWLLLIPLNVWALLIYWLLKDYSTEPEDIKCAGCGAANHPNSSTCRLCADPLRPVS